jgi:hypothetical protein
MQTLDDDRRRAPKLQYGSTQMKHFGSDLVRYIECILDAEKLNVNISSLLDLPTIDEFCYGKKGRTIVRLANIKPEDNKCAICWLPYYEVDDEIDYEAMALFAELPCATKDIRRNNAPLKVRCGHIFGHSCILKSVMAGDLMCPLRCGYLCRKSVFDLPVRS